MKPIVALLQVTVMVGAAFAASAVSAHTQLRLSDKETSERIGQFRLINEELHAVEFSIIVYDHDMKPVPYRTNWPENLIRVNGGGSKDYWVEIHSDVLVPVDLRVCSTAERYRLPSGEDHIPRVKTRICSSLNLN